MMTYGDLETMYRPGTYGKVGQRVYYPLPDGSRKEGTIRDSDFKCKVGVLHGVKWDDGSIGFVYVCHLRYVE